MESVKLCYRDLVFAALLNCEGEYIIERKVKPENQKKFIEACKEIIERGVDAANDIIIELNNDYTKVRVRPVFKKDTLKTFCTKANKFLGNA